MQHLDPCTVRRPRSHARHAQRSDRWFSFIFPPPRRPQNRPFKKKENNNAPIGGVFSFPVSWVSHTLQQTHASFISFMSTPDHPNQRPLISSFLGPLFSFLPHWRCQDRPLEKSQKHSVCRCQRKQCCSQVLEVRHTLKVTGPSERKTKKKSTAIFVVAGAHRSFLFPLPSSLCSLSPSQAHFAKGLSSQHSFLLQRLWRREKEMSTAALNPEP